MDDVILENNNDSCLTPPPGFTPPVIENAVRDIPCFILCTHYLVITSKDDDFDNEEKMKVEMIRRMNRFLENKKFYLEPAEVSGSTNQKVIPCRFGRDWFMDLC